MTPPDPTEIAVLCERLRGLLSRATPGPWPNVFEQKKASIDAALIVEAINALPKLLDALEALSAGGWKLVPVEPTREMWAAGGNAVLGHRQRHHDKVVKDVWSAMLAAVDKDSVRPREGEGR